jgi:DNA-binding Xre family transcriptional regulator
MGIKFYKLLDLLNRKGINKEELRKRTNISSSTMAKISKNEYVSLKVIESICRELNCQPGDIMEYISEEDKKS